MRQKIDIDNWERKDTFNFFKTFQLPVLSLTSEIDCTKAFRACKENKLSFFRLCIYSALRAINEIREFRYRIEDGEVVEYDHVNLLTPIKTSDDGKFVEAFVEYNKDFATFYQAVGDSIESVKNITDPYAHMNKSDGKGGLACISCVPDLYFTSVSPTYKDNDTYNINIATIGKAIERGDSMYIPIAICAHHGLSDGYHISMFLKKTAEYMEEYSR